MKLTPIETTFLKFILKELRYLPRTELVGREVMINSIDTLADDIRSALDSTFAEIGELLSTNCVGTLAKYGLLDLSFSVPSNLLESKGKVSIAVLKEMGLLNDRFEPERSEDFNELIPGEMPNDLKELVEDILDDDKAFEYDGLTIKFVGEDLLENKTVLRLFLIDKNYSFLRKNKSSFQKIRKEYIRTGRLQIQLEHDYLPRTLTIIDACITNAPGLWFEKHFYL